jgi:hypothetical protein
VVVDVVVPPNVVGHGSIVAQVGSSPADRINPGGDATARRYPDGAVHGADWFRRCAEKPNRATRGAQTR